MPRVDLICVYGLFFKYYLLCIEDIRDSKCLGKEPWRFKGFRDEKWRRKVETLVCRDQGHRASYRPKVESLSIGPLSGAPARAPQLGL